MSSWPTCHCDPLTGWCAGDDPDDVCSINEFIGGVINKGLGIVGSIALAMFTIAGLVFMFSAGNMERVQKAKNIMIYSAIGMVVIFSAYAMANFVLGAVTWTSII